MWILFPHTFRNTTPGTPLGKLKCQRMYYDTIPRSDRSKSFVWGCQIVLHMRDISRSLFVGAEDAVEVYVCVDVDGAHG